MTKKIKNNHLMLSMLMTILLMQWMHKKMIWIKVIMTQGFKLLTKRVLLGMNHSMKILKSINLTQQHILMIMLIQYIVYLYLNNLRRMEVLFLLVEMEEIKFTFGQLPKKAILLLSLLPNLVMLLRKRRKRILTLQKKKQFRVLKCSKP